MTRVTLWIGMALGLSALLGATALARKSAAPPCTGRFLVLDAPLLPGAAVPVDAVVLATGRLMSIDSGCQAVRGRLKSSRKGTSVRAVWRSCQGVRGRVLLTGKVDPACSTLKARLVAPRAKPKLKLRFTAHRSTCGDGVMDGANGEICEGTSGCSRRTRCSMDCLCLPVDEGAVERLEGDPAASALAAVTTLDANGGVPSTAVELDAVGARVARTEVDLGFRETATVGAINALLAGLGGRIVNMIAGVPMLLIRIPDPGSLAALDTLLGQLRADPVVEFADRSYFAATQALPDNHDASSAQIVKIAHQLAIRAHGAWNAAAAVRLATSSPPTLVMADNFGGGLPLADFDVVADSSDFGSGALDPHGYMTLGVVGADHDGPVTDRGLATGLYPAPLRLIAVDGVVAAVGSTRYELAMRAIEYALLQQIEGLPAGSRAVVNTSLGFPCETPAQVGQFCIDGYARQEGGKWLRLVRGGGLEGSFAHFSAAGNSVVAGDVEARFASPFNAAHLINDLTLPDGTPLVPLDNVRVVENVLHEPDAPYRPACLSADSKYDGDLAAIGTDVWSLEGPVSGAGLASGSSLAAAQVAALAAYVWTLDPSLSPFGLLDLLETTARPDSTNTAADARCSPRYSARVVDAYGAVLAADSPAGTPVRGTILDVADDAGAPGSNLRFDEKDVQLLLSLFQLQAGTLDYSRYDLNGDGWTGGGHRERLDLDLDGTYGSVSQQIEGEKVDFAENRLTDRNILCYYAYSSVFSGSVDERRRILAGQCANPCGALNAVTVLDVDIAGRDIGHLERYETTSDSVILAASAGGESASVEATFGTLRAHTRLQLPLQVWWTGMVSGSARFQDVGQVIPEDSSLLRKSGTLRARVRVTSSLSAVTDPASEWPACAQVLFPNRDHSAYIFFDRRGCLDCGEAGCRGTPGIYTVDIPFVFGEAFGFGLWLQIGAGFHVQWYSGNPPPEAAGSAEASGSLEWQSFDVLDAGGAPVMAYTFCTGSGAF